MHRFRGEHPSRGEHAGDRTDQDAADAEEPRDIDRMQRPAAAEGHQREVARILAALDRHRADRARHVDVGDLTDAVRRVLHR